MESGEWTGIVFSFSTLHFQFPITELRIFVDMEAEEPIVSYGQLNPEGSYTYWDYLKWKLDERVELIKGKIWKMSPALGSSHQKISMNLTRFFLSVFAENPCELFSAPFDVRLPIPNAHKDTTVVQPDLCVIYDRSKIDSRGCDGAPDLVVEILSPGNSKHEMQTKFSLYQESGVKEYWIVEPAEKAIFVYTLQNGTYIGLRPFVEGMRVESPLFPQLEVQVSDVFYGVKEYSI